MIKTPLQGGCTQCVVGGVTGCGASSAPGWSGACSWSPSWAGQWAWPATSSPGEATCTRVAAVTRAVSRSRATCRQVGISSQHCAVLYDEEDCDTSSDLLRVQDGEQGRLAKWAPFSSTLQRNDLEVEIDVFQSC